MRPMPPIATRRAPAPTPFRPRSPPRPGPDGRRRVLRRGWGFAPLVPSPVQPDDGAGLREGVIGFTTGRHPRANDGWGALRAWAWGASRAYDFLALDPHVDRRRIAIE